VTALLFAAVVLVAATVWVMRGVRTRRARASLRRGPGTSLEDALPVTSFEQIDRMVAARRCHCGAGVHTVGEGTRAAGDRRFRYTRLECDTCEDEHWLFFDVTTIFH
jgi:hypothetical protein